MSSNLLTRIGGTNILVFDQSKWISISIKEVAEKFICIEVLSSILTADFLADMSFLIASSLTLMFSFAMPASNIFSG